LRNIGVSLLQATNGRFVAVISEPPVSWLGRFDTDRDHCASRSATASDLCLFGRSKGCSCGHPLRFNITVWCDR